MSDTDQLTDLDLSDLDLLDDDDRRRHGSCSKCYPPPIRPMTARTLGCLVCGARP